MEDANFLDKNRIKSRKRKVQSWELEPMRDEDDASTASGNERGNELTYWYCS